MRLKKKIDLRTLNLLHYVEKSRCFSFGIREVLHEPLRDFRSLDHTLLRYANQVRRHDIFSKLNRL